MLLTGWTPEQIKQAFAQADVARRSVQGVSKADILQGMLETKSVFSSAPEAIRLAPKLSEAESVIRAAAEGHPWLGGDIHSHAMAVVKSAEMLGAVNKREDFQKVMDTMLKASILSGGRVTPEMFQQQIATEGPSRYLWGQDAQMLYLTHLTQEMATGSGGARGRAGVEMKTAAQTLLQGTMNKAFANSMWNLGVLSGSPNTFASPKGSWAFETVTGPVKGADLLRTDPLAWADKYLIPALEKRYPNFRNMEPGAQAMAFNQAIQGGPAYTRSFLSEITLTNPRLNIARQAAQRASLPGAQQLTAIAGQDPVNRLNSVNAAFTSLISRIGENAVAVKVFNSALTGLLNLLNRLDQMASAFNVVTARFTSSSNEINKAAVMFSKAIGMVIDTLVTAPARFVKQTIANDAAVLNDVFKGQWDKLGKDLGQAANIKAPYSALTQFPSPLGIPHHAPVPSPVATAAPGGGVLGRLRGPASVHPQNTTVQADIHVTLDGKEIAKHTAPIVVKQTGKQLVKAQRTMSYAGSRAGGSYTDGVHNAGGNQ